MSRRSRRALPKRVVASRRSDPLAAPDSGLDSALRLTGVALVAAKLLVVPLAMDPAGEDSFGIPKSAVSRAVLYAMIIVGAVYLARYRRWTVSRGIGLASVAFLLVSAAATAAAIDPVTATYGAPRRLLGLTSIADGVGTAAATALFLRTHRDAAALGIAAATGVAFALAYEAVQLAGGDPVTWSERLIGSFIGNPTSLAGYLAIAAAAIAATLVLHWKVFGLRLRVGVVALLLGTVVGTALTGARGPTLALIPALAFVLLLCSRAGVLRFQPRTLLVIGSLGAILVGAYLASPGGERIARLFTGDTSAIERGVIYETALRAIALRPLLGIGPDGLGAIYLELKPDTTHLAVAATATSTHSWLLHVAVGSGVAGLLVFIVLVGLAVARGWGRATQPGATPSTVGAAIVVAYLIQGLPTINSIVVDMALWVGIGLAASQPLEPNPVPARTRRGEGWKPMAVVAIAAILAASTVTGVLESNRAVRESNRARAATDFVRAERAARLALDRDSGRADTWNVLGLAHSRRQPANAAAAFARAVELAPRDPVYRLNLAAEIVVAFAADQSRLGGASEHARRAIELDRNGVQTFTRAAEIFAAVGRWEEAITAARRAAELHPTDPRMHERLSDVLAGAGRAEEAIMALDRSIAVDPSQSVLERSALREDLRLRYSRLYRSLGRIDEARRIIRPPSAQKSDVSCVPVNGTVDAGGGSMRPRCFRVFFVSEEDLLAEGPGSVRDASRYAIDGSPLPPGSVIDYDRSRRIATVQLPPAATPPRSGNYAVVTGIANVLGQVIEPPTARLPLP